ncbi:MAG: hypothetical protein U5L96_06180 [Owenweeksia sp.]|nr:hypothetical protein [Owenweeksia sp.]
MPLLKDRDSIRRFYAQEALLRDSSHYIDWDALGSGHYAGLQIEDFMIAQTQNRIVGIMGAWDQSALKRIRVVRYQKPLSWFRPVLNLISPLVGSIPLPKAGNCLNVLSATGICISEK